MRRDEKEKWIIAIYSSSFDNFFSILKIFNISSFII